MLSPYMSRQQGHSPGTPVLASPHTALQTPQTQTYFFQKSQGPEMDLGEVGVRGSEPVLWAPPEVISGFFFH